MNVKTALLIALALIGVGIIAVLWHVTAVPSSLPSSMATPSATTTGTVPSGTTSVAAPAPVTNGSVTGSATITIADQGGRSVAVNDFIHNGSTVSDAANTGGYLLAGNLGYCVSDPQKCQAATSTDFTVYYNSGPQSFLIELTEEPIGQARLHMEQFLMTTLGLSEAQMCDLNYLVGVTRYVNAQYTGKNLGFSFCPKATPLPQ
jgi:hypothetical protein